MGNIGLPEILIVFSTILIFFGAKRLPEIAKGLGKGIKNFKSEINSMKETVEPFNKEIKKWKHSNFLLPFCFWAYQL